MNLDTIFNLLRTLLGGLIDKFKAANPATYNAIVTILLTAAGFIGVLIANNVAPGLHSVFEIVLIVISGILTVIGANEIARRAERFPNVTKVASTRVWLISLLMVGGFVASVWLFTKNEKAFTPADGTVLQLQLTDENESKDGFVLQSNLDLPDPQKPLTSYTVTLLAEKLDTVSTVAVPGLPSLKIERLNQYTFPLFPVAIDHVPIFSDFDGKLILKDGYKLKRIVMIQVYPDK